MMFAIITILALIPMAAIASNAWLKGKELENNKKLSSEDKTLVQQLTIENQELRERIENLETMIADVDLSNFKTIKADQDSEAIQI